MRTTTSPACRQTGLHPDPRDEATPPLKGGEFEIKIRFEIAHMFLNNAQSKKSLPFLREGGLKLRIEL